ncbi:MAG: pyrroline-5-carboxylate reductase [Thermoguttaceae bacterium]|nr:pyrroline-5-carboxylate reductase [Thermoguttaceae bacterium]
MSNKESTIGFIGTGQMASALAGTFAKDSSLNVKKLLGYDIVPQSLEKFCNKIGAEGCDSIAALAQAADIIFLSVKPQQMHTVLGELKIALSGRASEKLIVTIAAGLPIAFYEQVLGNTIRLVRVMPNTPCLVGEGACAFVLSPGALPEDAQTVKGLLQAVGVVIELQEKLLDAVTGLSGSGPAYVFMAIEALADGGVKMGLPRNVALELAAQTLKGSAEMYLTSREHPGALKDKVTSPGGTTIAGVAVLEACGFRSALIDAVEAATVRSMELGKH